MNWFSESRRDRQLDATYRKTKPMTADDLSSRGLKRHVALALERAHSSSPKPRDQFSVLDIGCGRGETVALLRRDGWDAFGAEIDPEQADLARDGLKTLGDIPGIILDISSGGIIDAEDNRFDFLFSEQVVEHVRDLKTFVTETHRVLKPGGAAFHVFPSRWRVLEPHIGQPFVHWLPKGRSQSRAIRFWTALRVEASWVPLEGSPAAAKADAYTSYMTERTFYRSRSEIERMFEGLFATCDSYVIGELLAEKLGLSVLLAWRPIRRLLEEVCVVLYSSAMYLTKSKSITG